MRREKNEIRMTLLFGKQQNQKNLSGLPLGEKDDLAGILSAQQWPALSLEKEWTFTLEELI
jgi:hypothetical protein